VIIESPFITLRRLHTLLPTLSRLTDRGVRVVVNTRDPLEESDAFWSRETTIAVRLLQKIGVNVLYTVGHHRKLAMIDDYILWEGSLNILSQHDSCEVMRRIVSESEVTRMKKFINLTPWLG
jgi:phosphatidylserine/phosphatidylglycerophosphate/cardiolipin synthase-like enzyme